MNIGIITYHNGSNYGAALQAFALQEYIKKLNVSTRIINYSNVQISKGVRPIRWGLSKVDIYNSVIDIFDFKNSKSKVEKFNTFFQMYYNLTELLTKSELKNQGAGVDICISGSDQIWNPHICGELDDIYLGAIAGVRKRFSYASSFGNYSFDDQNVNKTLKKNLEKFSGVSVREKADVLENRIGVRAETVIDPTLLLTKEEWESKFELEKGKRRYLLVYVMTNARKVLELSIKIANLLKTEVIMIGRGIGQGYREVEYVSDVGPKEFVNLFYNASFVVTNSFHGTAFSINFKKPFVTIRNETSPERAERLLNTTGLTDRLVKLPISDKELERIIGEKIDSESVQSFLVDERKKSKGYLESNLKYH